MKRTLLFLALLTCTWAFSQTVIGSEDFESYSDFQISPLPGWTYVDNDGGTTWGSDTYDFTNEGYVGTAIVFNPSATTPSAAGTAWDPHGGSKGLYFFSSGANSTTTPNDDWVISPQTNIAGNGQLSFWAKSITDTYGLERIQIMVSTSNTNPSSFTAIDIDQDLDSGNTLAYQEVPTTWTNITVDLSAYANSSIYIAIHYVSNDAFVLLTDDYQVTDDSPASLSSNDITDFNHYINEGALMISSNSNIFNSVSVIDITGKTILSKKLNSNNESVSLANLSEGLYFAKVTTQDNKIKTFKFIVR